MNPRAPESAGVGLERLLEETHWIRGLALHLLRDENLVDDVVQKTFLAWLRSPPRSSDRVRPWLGQVIRNFVRLSIREDRRRHRREERSARPDLQPSEDLSELGELRDRVARAVLELEEPYLSTVVLHFFEELSTREIGRRQGVSANTVQVRLKRATEQLKQRLTHYYKGNRHHWMTGLALLSGMEPGGVAALPSSSTPSRDALDATESASTADAPLGKRRDAVVVTAVVAAIVLGLFFLGPGFSGGDEDPTTRVAARTAEPTHARRGDDGERDVAGSPLVSDTSTEVRNVRGPNLALAPAHRVALVQVVSDDTGQPVAGAEIRLAEYANDSRHVAYRGRDLVSFVMRAPETTIQTRTDADGRASLPSELLQRGRLSAAAAGHSEHFEDPRWRAVAPGPYEIRLRAAPRTTLEVRDEHDRPVSGAHVRVLGRLGTQHQGLTSGSGEFSVLLEDAFSTVTISAPGFAAVRALAEAPRQRITLVPGEPGVGAVVDARGQSIESCRVEVLAPPHWRGEGWTTASDAAGSFTTFDLPSEGNVRLVLDHPDHISRELEVALPWTEPQSITLEDGAILVGRVTGPGGPLTEGLVTAVPTTAAFRAVDLPSTEIAADGTFRLPAVPPGSGTLLVEHPVLASREMSFEDLEIGELRTIRVRLDVGVPFRGRAVGSDGSAASGVRLRLGRVFGDEIRGRTVTTDSEGHFLFTGVAQPDPPVRAARRDTRWSALAAPEKELPAQGRILEVLRPHQLRMADGTPVPDLGLLGSRNTLAVTKRELELVVDAGRVPDFRVRLSTETGDPIRTVTNLLIARPDAPSDVHTMFAGTTGTPWNRQATPALDGCLLGFWTRSYGLVFRTIHLDGDQNNFEVTLAKAAPTRFHVRDDDGDSVVDLPLFAISETEEEPFAAVFLGATGGDGQRLVDFLPPGPYRVLTLSGGRAEEDWRPQTTLWPLSALKDLGFVDVERDDEVGEITLRR